MLGLDARTLRVVWTVFFFSLGVLIIYTIRDTLLVFGAAVFLAYMIWPVVMFAERFVPRRRTIALAVVYILLIGAIVGIGFALVPHMIDEATNLAIKLPGMFSGGMLARIPIPHWLQPERDQLLGVLQREAKTLESRLVPLLQAMGSKILSGVTFVLPIILVPILAFFFLKDGNAIRCALLGTVDEADRRGALDQILDDIHHVLKNYIRALVLLSITSFCAFALFLGLMRYPYEILLAGIAGALEFIPVIGPAAGLLIMLIVVAAAGSGGLLWIVIFWGCYRVFQDYILNPYLMSSGVELHPLLVLFGVLAGEKIGGIPGMFFSVPVLAIVRVVYNHLRGSYTRGQLARV
jgi:predicted PurR-regulated permease PerM